MKILGPTPSQRLNEAVGVLSLLAVTGMLLSLVSYDPQDPSWNTATGSLVRHNILGRFGGWYSDLALQIWGLAAFVFPALILVLGWCWIRSTEIESPWAKIIGSTLLVGSVCTALSLMPDWRIYNTILPGGVVGLLIAQGLISWLNVTGTALLMAACVIVSLYLMTSFSLDVIPVWLAHPSLGIGRIRGSIQDWIARHSRRRVRAPKLEAVPKPRKQTLEHVEDPAPWEGEIPIRTLDEAAYEDEPVAPAAIPPLYLEPQLVEYHAPAPLAVAPKRERVVESKSLARYELPPTTLLTEAEARNSYDAQELKETASRIKAKLEEFNVLGSVVQINPGPVVTTFEYKPDAGIKYSRITTLMEDLCMGLQAESILIERIPGKMTVGIEVPNTKREVISLRQILESDEFRSSNSKMTIALGKDISGRIKVAALDAMPHLLIAGSTGSGKSVMLNSLIMSVLFKSSPHEVKMILIDPKRVEMGIYEGIPHLLTPVITDPKKATNALRNAVLEMERRLKLLASHGVRNIEQFNKKIKAKLAAPRSLFTDDDAEEAEELQPLPYILIMIDELADLMMLERNNVEESITRLAQMARAVGMHLVVATQRPSVDVITGLIKANFPARVSFRVATRVDSRTILDVMGAEHLLGRGDMLFLPPGSSRLTRVHAPYVSETETNDVVDFWKVQEKPEYDQTFLMAPPSDDGEIEVDGEAEGPADPMYEDAVRVVLEVGKASTSILQRRLRLGYGRAARMLDVMQRDGLIGPPDGSRPREVLKRPDWLKEVEGQMR
jgi:S-DNA-T family DNA segregation ATPase FtsK/SpoIIIE